jgi:hypothetical protein
MLLVERVAAPDSRLGQQSSTDSIPTGGGPLRPFAVISAKVVDGTGAPVVGQRLQVRHFQTNQILQELPTDSNGTVNFAFDFPVLPHLAIVPVGTSGFNFMPNEYRSSKHIRVYAQPVVAVSGPGDYDKRPPWDPNDPNQTFIFARVKSDGFFAQLLNPWVIGAVAVVGYILYRQLRED